MLHSGPYFFQTTRPRTRWMSLSHPEWLYILPTQDIDGATLYLDCYNQADTKTTKSVSLGDLKYGKAIWVDISHSLRTYAVSSGTLRYIHAYIDDTSYDDLIYYTYTPTGDDIRAIYYHNSAGGLDSLVTTAEQLTAYEFQSLETKKAMELDFIQGWDHTSRITNTRASKIETLHTGHRPAGEIRSLVENFFLLKRGYEYREIATDFPFLMPIIPLVSTQQLPASRSSIQQVSFQYKYASDQRAYDRTI